MSFLGIGLSGEGAMKSAITQGQHIAGIDQRIHEQLPTVLQQLWAQYNAGPYGTAADQSALHAAQNTLASSYQTGLKQAAMAAGLSGLGNSSFNQSRLLQNLQRYGQGNQGLLANFMQAQQQRKDNALAQLLSSTANAGTSALNAYQMAGGMGNGLAQNSIAGFNWLENVGRDVLNYMAATQKP